MYIEYITPQRVADPNFTDYKSKGGDYRPTWLVRTVDWQKVPGAQATDGYHTISYVWEQSGEMFQMEDGEYSLKDNGHHQLTTITFKKQKTRRSSTNIRKVKSTKHVTFEKLLQQICKDFDVDYLWYDKICINQMDSAEKHREIKDMHLIYNNARFTLALVPEVNIRDERQFERISWVTNFPEAKDKALHQMVRSKWWTRSWTLEELMMSTRIAIVGRNTYFWSLAKEKQIVMKENDALAHNLLGYSDRDLKSVNQILRYAHFRTSTKDHDKIFALSNILQGVIDIEIDYNVDVSVAMNDFYRKLAEHDLSIMCFGSVLDRGGAPRYATTMVDHKLPSWTGVSGMHFNRATTDIAFDNQGDGYYVDKDLSLYLKCRSYTIHPSVHDELNFIAGERGKQARQKYFQRITSMNDFDDERAALDWSQYCAYSVTDCGPTHYWKPPINSSGIYAPVTSLSLTEMCNECIILSVIFTIRIGFLTAETGALDFHYEYLAPVIRKDLDSSCYKAVGIIHLRHFQHDEPRPTPREFMSEMFSGSSCKTQDFCIK